jgi:hypothetical protein
MASAFGLVDVVGDLLKHDKMVMNANDKDDGTPLMLASTCNRVGVVRELLKHVKVVVNHTC